MILLQNINLPLQGESMILRTVSQSWEVLLLFVFWIMVFAVIAWFWAMPTFFYPIKVVIASKRGNGEVFSFDKGRWVKKKNQPVRFKLWKRKQLEIYPPTLQNQYPLATMLAKNIIFFREKDNDNYFPCSTTSGIQDHSLLEYSDVTMLQKNLYHSILGTSDNIYRPQAGFLEKYGHYMGFALLLVGSFVIIYLTLGKVGEISEALSATGSQVAQALENVNAAAIGAKP